MEVLSDTWQVFSRWDVPSILLFIILFSCGNYIYIQLSTMEEDSATKLWTVRRLRPLHGQSKDGPPWWLWVESGTEVCARMWTEGTDTGLETAVLVLVLENAQTHDLKCGQQKFDYN